jgi:hypothetical protein
MLINNSYKNYNEISLKNIVVVIFQTVLINKMNVITGASNI